MDMALLIAVGAAVAGVFGVFVASRTGTPTVPRHERDHDVSVERSAGSRTYRLGLAGARQRIIRKCSIGERLQLVPDLGNPSNKRTVGVFRQSGEQVGYLPRGHGLLKEIMDGRVAAAVDTIRAGSLAKPARGMVLAVTVRD
jgi:HIRAN domain